MNLVKRTLFASIFTQPNSKVANVNYCKFTKVLPYQNFLPYDNFFTGDSLVGNGKLKPFIYNPGQLFF